jgi:hypothetical protein
MFIRSFIELLKIFNKIITYVTSNHLIYNNTFHLNLYTVKEYLQITYIYNDFITYYHNWYSSYYNKI